MRIASGRTRAWTGPDVAEPSSNGTRVPSSSTPPLAAVPGIRLVNPTNSATKRVFGRS
jgi:hypothetical protein